MKKLSLLSFFKSSNKNTMPKLVSGFTLVELLVTITMFVIVTGVVLVNSNQFDSSVLLNNFAYDVALTIRQAQSYGVNVSESIKGSFNSYYGVYFDVSSSGSLTNFMFFDYTPQNINDPLEFTTVINSVDINKSCSEYYPTCIQKYTMRRGTSIQSICAGESESTCQPLNGKLAVMFKRPNLDALIYTVTASGTLEPPNNYAKIILSSSNGATSTVVVTSVGQIYVKK